MDRILREPLRKTEMLSTYHSLQNRNVICSCGGFVATCESVDGAGDAMVSETWND